MFKNHLFRLVFGLDLDSGVKKFEWIFIKRLKVAPVLIQS